MCIIYIIKISSQFFLEKVWKSTALKKLREAWGNWAVKRLTESPRGWRIKSGLMASHACR